MHNEKEMNDCKEMTRIFLVAFDIEDSYRTCSGAYQWLGSADCHRMIYRKGATPGTL